MNLEPQAVAVRDIPGWLQESGKLFLRRGFLFLGISLVYHFLALSAESFRLFSLLAALLLCQVCVCVSIAGAHSADHSRGISLAAACELLRHILWPLALLTVLYCLIYLAGAAVVLALGLDLPGGDHTGAPAMDLLSWLMLGNTAFLVLFMGTTVSTLWFLGPLITLHDLTLREAVLLAKRAESKNEWVVFLVSYVPCVALVVMALLSEWTLALGVVLVPLLGVVQYVAYRHVFLGRKSNAPVPVRAMHTAAASGVG